MGEREDPINHEKTAGQIRNEMVTAGNNRGALERIAKSNPRAIVREAALDIVEEVADVALTVGQILDDSDLINLAASIILHSGAYSPEAKEKAKNPFSQRRSSN